jgi:hypothetical protein
MAGSPSTYENIKSVPLYVQFNWRGQNTGGVQADAWAKNVFLEKDGEEPYSVKRPGLTVAGSLAPSGLNLQIQGLVQEYPAPNYNGGAYGPIAAPRAIIGDNYVNLLTGLNPLYSSPNAPGNNVLPLGGGQPAGCWYTSLPLPSLGAPASGSLPFTVFQSAYGVYVGLWAHVPLVSTKQTFAYVAPNESLLPGIAQINSTYYTLGISGNVWASASGTVSSWPVLNYVVADNAIGPPLALTSLGSYLVVFGQLGFQLWYDAGISPGAPIAAVQNGIFLSGMADAGAFSLVKTETQLIWLSSSAEGNLSVKSFNGQSVSTLSTPAVERFLTANFGPITPPTQQASSISIRGSILRTAGHEFYVLSAISPSAGAAGTGGVTLVYDLGTGAWVVWTQQTALAYGEGALRAWQVLGVPGGASYFPDMNNGTVLQISEQAYQDNGQSINVLIQTDLYNWGNQRTKIIPATYPLLDTVNSTVYLSWTDNDYSTFSTPQAITTMNAKKQLIRCGSTVQRAWQLTHTDNTPMRFYALELEVVPGAL